MTEKFYQDREHDFATSARAKEQLDDKWNSRYKALVEKLHNEAEQFIQKEQQEKKLLGKVHDVIKLGMENAAYLDMLDDATLKEMSKETKEKIELLDKYEREADKDQRDRIRAKLESKGYIEKDEKETLRDRIKKTLGMKSKEELEKDL